jgi:hypothetical protein
VNLIGKLANGIADELIPAMLLASEIPAVIVPVANESMLLHPATRRNLRSSAATATWWLIHRRPWRSRRGKASTNALGPFPLSRATHVSVRSCRLGSTLRCRSGRKPESELQRAALPRPCMQSSRLGLERTRVALE